MSRRFQFSLRAMLVFITVICVWLGTHVERAMRQQEAVAVILRLHGKVAYSRDYDPVDPDGIRLRNFVDDGRQREWIDYFDDVRFVWFPGNASDENCKHVEKIYSLRRLALDGRGLTDAGLKRLYRLSRLEELWLIETSVTDVGVNKLKSALPHCSINYPWPQRQPAEDKRCSRCEPPT